MKIKNQKLEGVPIFQVKPNDVLLVQWRGLEMSDGQGHWFPQQSDIDDLKALFEEALLKPRL